MSSEIFTALAPEIAARARVDVTRVTADAHLILDLGLGSLDMLSVLAVAEVRFHAKFPDELLHTLTTLGKIEAAVASHPRSPPKGAP